MLRREHKWEGEVEEESKDSEYDWCTFYTSMNIEHWNC
jgi:hypothetical protein